MKKTFIIITVTLIIGLYGGSFLEKHKFSNTETMFSFLDIKPKVEFNEKVTVKFSNSIFSRFIKIDIQRIDINRNISGTLTVTCSDGTVLNMKCVRTPKDNFLVDNLDYVICSDLLNMGIEVDLTISTFKQDDSNRYYSVDYSEHRYVDQMTTLPQFGYIYPSTIYYN